MMQLNADFKNLYDFLTPFPVSDNEMLIYDSRGLPLPAKDITFMHYHNCCELGIVLSGNGLFAVDDKIYSISTGDIIFIPEHVRHYSKSLDPDERTRCRFIYFDAERLLRTIGISDDGKIHDLLKRLDSTQPILTDNDGRYGALKRFTDEVFENDGGDKSLCGVYFYEFLLKCKPLEPSQSNTRPDSLMDSVIKYMTLHFNDEISVSTLAELCYLSKSQLCRRFSSAYGISPIAWLNRFRLYSAKEMLRSTDYSIAQVCEKSGFQNPNDLYRKFKAKFGLSPSQYRAKMQKQRDVL